MHKLLSSDENSGSIDQIARYYNFVKRKNLTEPKKRKEKGTTVLQYFLLDQLPSY